MMVVKVELWIHGDSTRIRPLGRALISLDPKTATPNYGDYAVVLTKFDDNKVWKIGTVKGHNRKRRGPWDLLYRALKSIVGDRNDNIEVVKLKKVIKEARKGAFGFMIRSNETLQEGMSRNFNEFFEETVRLNNIIEGLKAKCRE